MELLHLICFFISSMFGGPRWKYIVGSLGKSDLTNLDLSKISLNVCNNTISGIL